MAVSRQVGDQSSIVRVLQSLQHLSKGPTLGQVQNLIGTQSTPSQTQQPIVYSYRVKIINPSKKSDIIVRQLHRFTSKFTSVSALRDKLIDYSHVPEFNVGYMEGSQQSSKIWLVTSDDLESMYKRYPKGGQIIMWCDGKVHVGEKKKRDSEESTGRRQEKEDEVDSVYKELLEKHGGAFETPKLRLWSRMLCSGVHSDYDSPPKIPAFFPPSPKKPKESLSDSLAGAAVAVVQALKSDTKQSDDTVMPTPAGVGLSPAMAVDLRMKNYEQLRYLQQLLKDGILSE